MIRSLTALLLLAFSVPAIAQTTALVGAKVHTVGPEGTIENATIVIVDGRIDAVGTGLPVPAGATTIDAGGKIITPGLFSPSGQLGLVEVGLSAGWRVARAGRGSSLPRVCLQPSRPRCRLR